MTRLLILDLVYGSFRKELRWHPAFQYLSLGSCLSLDSKIKFYVKLYLNLTQMENYIHTTQKQGQAFFMDYHQKGKVVMLNLLRFREVADYSDLESIRPEEDLSGRAAYMLYAKNAIPLLEKAGSKVLFSGNCSGFLIGPDEEKWDYMLLVEHESAAQFIAFAQDEAYLKIAGHRTAALLSSRLLPITQSKL
jgi:uncharacterized protein (DUF1330 family)